MHYSHPFVEEQIETQGENDSEVMARWDMKYQGPTQSLKSYEWMAHRYEGPKKSRPIFKGVSL